MATKTVGNLGGIEGIKVVCRDGNCWPRQYGKDVAKVQIGKRTIVAHPKSKKGQGAGKGNVAQKSAFAAAARSCKGTGSGFRACMSAALTGGAPKKKARKKGKK